MNVLSHVTKARNGIIHLYFMSDDAYAYCHVYEYDDDQDTWYIEGLSVEHEYQRNGYGTLLLDFVEENAKDIGIKTIMLWAYTDDWPIEWCQRRGYKILQPHDNISNAVWLVKTLELMDK